jgi:hypothetical protein
VTRAIVVALLLGLALAGSAQAGVVSDEDAAELAQTLAEAQEEQDVCYGWNVTNNFSGSNDVGSSTLGPGQPLIVVGPSSCSKGSVILTGNIDYSCGSCESEDSASVSIESNLANPPTVDDLKDLGLNAGSLTGDDDDTTLINMVNALPLIVADRGNAPYVEYAATKDVPATDKATNTPGSDFIRDSWLQLVLCFGLIVGAVIVYFRKRGQSKPKRAVAPPAAPPPPPPAATGPESSPPPSPAT